MTSHTNSPVDVEQALLLVKARGRTRRRMRQAIVASAPVVVVVLVVLVVFTGRDLGRLPAKGPGSTIGAVSGAWHLDLRGEFHTAEGTHRGIDVTGRWSLAFESSVGALAPPPRSGIAPMVFRLKADRATLWQVTGPESTCASTPGLYRLSVRGDQMSLTPVQDRCLLRTQLLSLHPYVRG